MNFDPTDFSLEEPSKHELILDINEAALQLISMLRIQRDSDIERAILTIDTDANFTVPNFIIRNIASDSSLSALSIDAEISRLTNAAHFDIRIETSGEEDAYMNVSVGGDTAGEPRSSMLINDTELPFIEPPTRQEVNRFLASLFITNKTGDYSMFDEMDLANPHIAQRLLEGLKENAAETILDETYYLGDTIGMTADSIRFLEYNGTLQNAAISIEHHAKASSLELTFTSQPMPHELDEDIDNPEFMMQSLEGARTYEQNVNGELTQVASTNDHLTVMRDFLYARRASVFSEPEIETMNEDTLDDDTSDDFLENDQSQAPHSPRRATGHADQSLHINIEDLNLGD